MPENNEHSAEFCRGAVWMARMMGDEQGEGQYSALLAAAEASEATQPSAAEVIAAAEKALERLLPWALQAGANAEDALALCARWKEANGDGANTR